MDKTQERKLRSITIVATVMMFINLIFMFLPFVDAIPATAFSTAPVFLNTSTQWTGPLKGVNITLYGTASEIMSQLQVLDPEWTPAETNTTELRRVGLEERKETTRFCCPVASWNWQAINQEKLFQSAAKVKALGGWTHSQANACTLVECYEGAGIWLCDNSNNIDWTSTNLLISGYANDIAENCPPIGNYLDYDLCGQQFDSQGFNVVAHGC